MKKRLKLICYALTAVFTTQMFVIDTFPVEQTTAKQPLEQSAVQSAEQSVQHLVEQPAEQPELVVSGPSAVKAGDEFDVSVSVEDNTGITTFIIDLLFDKESFDCVSISKGNLFQSETSYRVRDFDDYYAVRVLAADLEAFLGNGALYTARFKAKTDAAFGRHLFDIVYKKGNIINEPGEKVNPSVTNLMIDVQGDSNTLTFMDGDGNPIDSLSTETLVTKMTYWNKANEPQNLTMIVAVYTPQGKLAYIGSNEKIVEVAQYADFIVRLEMLELRDGYYANVFLWDSATFVPITEKYMFQ